MHLRLMFADERPEVFEIGRLKTGEVGGVAGCQFLLADDSYCGGAAQAAGPLRKEESE